MFKQAIAYLVAAPIFFAIDMIWLGAMTPRFYKPILGDISLQNVNFPPAVIFYLLFPVGLIIFAIEPALKSASWQTAMTYGALFGFFAYATYDLTNNATLRNWTFSLTAVDIAWGSLLSAFSCVVTFLIVSRLAASS